LTDLKAIFKTIYKAIPFKKETFSLLRRIGSLPEPLYRHLYFKGIIKVNVGKGQDFKMAHYGHRLENELFWKGLYGWEKYSMKLWTFLCKDSKVIFDIGSNTGLYSLVAKTVNPNAEVHAFEPFEAIHKKLIRNAEINDFKICSNCSAISNNTGDAVIYTGDPNFAYSVTVNQNLWIKDKEPIELNIKTITLRDYIKQNKITGIDLMKIDVETHEPEVIEGFVPYVKQFKPIILIEILNDEVAQKLSNYFDPAEYYFYDIDEQTGIKKTGALSKSNSYNFLILPKEKEERLNSLIF
jgi:FkbM family methyltransferase